MHAVVCLALVAAIAVAAVNSEHCVGSDTNTCHHTHCGHGEVMTCAADMCTCVHGGHTGHTGHSCLTTHDCHEHCPHHEHRACVNLFCDCQ